MSKQHNLYFGAGIGVAIIVLLTLFANRGIGITVNTLSPTNYQSQFIAESTTHLLLDVRTPEEFAAGHIHGAINIPVESLGSRLSEVPADQPVVVYCRSGNRSAQASQILAQAGYSEIYDLGGLTTWTAQGFPIE